MTTRIHIGDRVEIPTHSDCWMRGDRYGEVRLILQQSPRAVVLLDKSGKNKAFNLNELRKI